jgi:transcription factor C subunit 6
LPRKTPALKSDQGGFHESYYQTDEQRLQERTTDWNWYWDYGSQAFVKNQKTRALTAQEGRKYSRIQQRNSKTVLLGNVKDRKPYQLDPLESINFGEAWENRSESAASEAPSKSSREGWLINVDDGKVQSIDWCPNSYGKFHFLAVSTIEIKKDETAPIKKLHKKAQARRGAKEQDRPIPQNAFTPAQGSPSCIQIWAIAAKDGHFNLSKAPALCQVICTDWGTVRHLKWSPASRTPKQKQNAKKVGLGLLGGLWSDGEVRVLDVTVNMAKDSTEWIHCTKTAFSHRPSSTIHTCITWLSSTHLAAGCANGFIAVYDLEALLSPSSSPFSKDKTQRPYFYHPVHHTYISSLTSGYPSRSNFIISSAMDGYVSVTDIHAPETDSMMSLRSRQGASALAWCEASQVILVGWEDTTIRFLHLRRSYASSIIGRTGSVATALATSKFHPCLIASSTDGAVVASNPLRKFWSFKSSVCQQIWFWHEWSNRNHNHNSNSNNGNSNNNHNNNNNEIEDEDEEEHVRGGGGISRFTDGFRVDKGPEKKGMYTKNSVLLATVYEEEQAATCVAWCPSLECAGWAAAGTGSGLLRIEDLSV